MRELLGFGWHKRVDARAESIRNDLARRLLWFWDDFLESVPLDLDLGSGKLDRGRFVELFFRDLHHLLADFCDLLRQK